MPIEQYEREDDLKQPPTMVGEGVACNGVDSSAERRAHMRELTMARQEAERRFSRSGIPNNADRPAADWPRQRNGPTNCGPSWRASMPSTDHGWWTKECMCRSDWPVRIRFRSADGPTRRSCW